MPHPMMFLFFHNADYRPFTKLAKLSRKCGKIFKSYTYIYPIVSVSGVENIKSLLKNKLKPIQRRLEHSCWEMII
jgi:hypothetical protein